MKKSKKEIRDRDRFLAKVFETIYVQSKLKVLCDNLGINTDHILRKDCGLYTKEGNLIPEASEIVNSYLMVNQILTELKDISHDHLYPILKEYVKDVKSVDSLLEFVRNVNDGKTTEGNLFAEKCPAVANIFKK